MKKLAMHATQQDHESPWKEALEACFPEFFGFAVSQSLSTD